MAEGQDGACRVEEVCWTYTAEPWAVSCLRGTHTCTQLLTWLTRWLLCHVACGGCFLCVAATVPDIVCTQLRSVKMESCEWQSEDVVLQPAAGRRAGSAFRWGATGSFMYFALHPSPSSCLKAGAALCCPLQHCCAPMPLCLCVLCSRAAGMRG